jgi:CRP-like cAMP-binding protein
MDRQIIEAMEHCPLFKGVEREELEVLMEHVAQCRIKYSRGQIVRNTGEACRYADIIIKGELLARMTGKTKHEVEVCRLTYGNIISPAFIFANNHNMPVTVIATKNTEMLRLEPEELLKLIDNYPTIRFNYICALSNIITFLTTKIRTLVLYSVKEKVARLIIDESTTQHSDTIYLHKSRQELADNFGIQKNSFIRALSNWVSDGAIEVKGKEIKIIDRKRLLELCP